jgi:AcrR family transcriptional regulator
MHHFPTKDAMLDAMVRRKVDAWREEYEAAIARTPPGKGRVLRALVDLCLSDTEECGDTECRRCFVLVAALVHDSKHVEAMREVHRDLAARVEADGLPPGLGESVHLAMNGLWFDRMFGLTAFTREKLTAIRDALLGVVGGAGEKSVRSVPKPARPAGKKVARGIAGGRARAGSAKKR